MLVTDVMQIRTSCPIAPAQKSKFSVASLIALHAELELEKGLAHRKLLKIIQNSDELNRIQVMDYPERKIDSFPFHMFENVA